MAGSRGQRVLNKVPHLHQISPQSRNKEPEPSEPCPPTMNVSDLSKSHTSQDHASLPHSSPTPCTRVKTGPLGSVQNLLAPGQHARMAITPLPSPGLRDRSLVFKGPVTRYHAYKQQTPQDPRGSLVLVHFLPSIQRKGHESIPGPHG